MAEVQAERILVIKLSALGDFFLALGAMGAIRKRHAAAHITLLTMRPFADIARRSGNFDDVRVDTRPRFYNIPEWVRLFSFFNRGMFSRIYDLQLNNRTSIYYRLFLKKPEWAGVVKGASHRHANGDWRQMHVFERHKEMLKELDIEVEFPDLSWMTSDMAFPELKKPYFLLVPGCAPTRPEKRWPAQKYGELSVHLTRLGFDVAVLGTAAERDALDCIVKVCPAVHDLAGKTSLYDVAALARSAAGAVGNDTGPLHLIAMAGCPTTALFFSASNPDLCRPIGRAVTVIRSDSPNDLSANEVLKKLGHLLGSSGPT